MEATSASSTDLPPECSPATLCFENNVTRVRINGTAMQAPILSTNTLSGIVRDFSLVLTATICGKKAKPIASRSELGKGARSPHTCPVRIAVYGSFKEKDAVAEALGSENLFLQHPGEAEFDRAVGYFNPQYLLAPGEDMPPIETLNIWRYCDAHIDSGNQQSLGELERAQVLRIFDSAYDTYAGELDATMPSPRLRTQLKRYRESIPLFSAIIW